MRGEVLYTIAVILLLFIFLWSVGKVIAAYVSARRSRALVDQSNDDVASNEAVETVWDLQEAARTRRTTWNLESARNHYSIPCALEECECANDPRKAGL